MRDKIVEDKVYKYLRELEDFSNWASRVKGDSVISLDDKAFIVGQVVLNVHAWFRSFIDCSDAVDVSINTSQDSKDGKALISRDYINKISPTYFERNA